MVTLFPVHSREIKNRQVTQKVNKEQICPLFNTYNLF